MDLLQFAAIRARALCDTAGMQTESYQEKRYAFAKDWASGNRWNTERTRAWVRKIKRELMQMRSAAPVKAGVSRHGAGSSGAL